MKIHLRTGGNMNLTKRIFHKYGSGCTFMKNTKSLSKIVKNLPKSDVRKNDLKGNFK